MSDRRSFLKTAFLTLSGVAFMSILNDKETKAAPASRIMSRLWSSKIREKRLAASA